MKVTQYVMAYKANWDMIKKLLPKGFESLRPVLRINAEMYDDDDEFGYVEFNTPVAKDDRRGWLNLTCWLAQPPYMDIRFKPTGKEGGCPHEADNDGCFYFDIEKMEYGFLEAENITENKEYCDCTLNWGLPPVDAFYPDDMTVRNFVMLPVEEILGAYRVTFER